MLNTYGGKLVFPAIKNIAEQFECVVFGIQQKTAPNRSCFFSASKKVRLILVLQQNACAGYGFSLGEKLAAKPTDEGPRKRQNGSITTFAVLRAVPSSVICLRKCHLPLQGEGLSRFNC